MKPSVVADSVGVLLLATVTALPLSCIPRVDAKQPNLQPFIAVAGTYSLMAADRGPTPAPAPPSTGCVEGCKCNGTGKEKSGDGLAIVPCRCPDTCSCKAAKKTAQATTCTTGSCGWPTRNMAR